MRNKQKKLKLYIKRLKTSCKFYQRGLFINRKKLKLYTKELFYKLGE